MISLKDIPYRVIINNILSRICIVISYSHQEKLYYAYVDVINPKIKLYKSYEEICFLNLYGYFKLDKMRKIWPLYINFDIVIPTKLHIYYREGKVSTFSFIGPLPIF